MEVHHPHHNHSGKKIKDYFYEFFMLFLAVTAGFIVENIREGYVERHRERQYIESLVEDLKADTTEINNVIDSYRNKVKGMDSLLKVIENPNPKNLTKNLYYFTFKYLNSAVFFEHSDRTISQLKNAGGLRLIQYAGVSDSIVAYYSSVANVEYNGEFDMKQLEKLLSFQKEIFDFKIIRQVDVSEMLNHPNLVIMDRNPKTIIRYYNEAFFFVVCINNYSNYLKELNVQAKSLLTFLEKEYDLK